MPYLGSTIFVVVLVLAMLLALTGYFLFARALFPSFVGRAEQAWSERPAVSFALGLPTTFVLAGISIGLLKAPAAALRLIGFPLTGLAIGFVFAGTAGLAAWIGRGLSTPSDAGREWVTLLRAGIVLELTMLFPLLGWFLVFPIAVIGGAGAAALSLRGRGTMRDRAPHDRAPHQPAAPAAPPAQHYDPPEPGPPVAGPPEAVPWTRRP